MTPTGSVGEVGRTTRSRISPVRFGATGEIPFDADGSKGVGGAGRRAGRGVSTARRWPEQSSRRRGNESRTQPLGKRNTVMNASINRITWIALVVLAAVVALGGCNTWEGAGKDVERTGEVMQGE